VAHVLRFYRLYHSSRYVGEQLVLRLQHGLTDEQMQCLNDEFGVMVASGCMKQCGPLEGEDDHLDLPRLVFHHTRRQFGLLRALIRFCICVAPGSCADRLRVERARTRRHG
jgi:hypothetical protein